MSHDIDFSTGRPAIAYVGDTPWHGYGQELPEGQPLETWLEAAQLSWEIQKLPVQYFFSGRLRIMDGQFVLARSDTGEALSTVSENYLVVQPKEVLEFFRVLVERHNYALETAGALNGGRKVWALARTGRVASLGGKAASERDDVAAYVLLATSFDKSLATTVAFTSVRVVCQNTLSFAMENLKGKKRQSLKVDHTRRFDKNQVYEELGLFDKAWDAFIQTVTRMAETPFDSMAARRFFEELFPRRKEGELSERAVQECQALASAMRSAPGQDLVTAKDTLWGALNAVTYYVDHVRSTGSGDRIDSAWFGAGEQLKEKAWEEACRLIGVET